MPTRDLDISDDDDWANPNTESQDQRDIKAHPTTTQVCWSNFQKILLPIKNYPTAFFNQR